MIACNYFYLCDDCVAPLRFRLTILHDGGFIADTLYNDMIRYIDSITETLLYYAPVVKKGLGENE